MLEKIEAIEAAAAKAKTELAKFIGGNQAAGTRVRLEMQQIKALAQFVRTSISEAKNAE